MRLVARVLPPLHWTGSKSRRIWRRLRVRLLSLRLREKLAAPYIGLALMAAICGAAGLAAVYRISVPLLLLSDVTSPLLMESMALAANAQDMRSTFVEGTAHASTQPGEIEQRLSQQDQEGLRHLESAQGLAARGGISAPFDHVTRDRHEFVTTLAGMTAAYRRKQGADALSVQRFDQTSRSLKATQAALYRITAEAESRIVESEEAAKVQVQMGQARIEQMGELFAQTVTETFAVVQNAAKMTRAVEQLHHAAQDASSAPNEVSLASLETEAAGLFKDAAASLRAVNSRLRDDQTALPSPQRSSHVTDQIPAKFQPPK